MQEKLGLIIRAGTQHEVKLGEISKQLETLRLSVEVSSLGLDLIGDVHILLSLANKATEKMCQSSILEALRFDRMDDRYDAIDEAYEKTFCWLFDNVSKRDKTPYADQDDPIILESIGEFERVRWRARKAFHTWLLSGQGIFHISGKPGSSKSTLMKYICEHKRTPELLGEWAEAKKLVFAKFFFWRHGSEGQKSLNGLLRSLLFSIVSALPDLIESLFPEQWNATKQSKIVSIRPRDVQNAFSRLLKHHDALESHRFAFFIDGLDEFEGREEKLLDALFSWVHARPMDIKMCVSSRELLVFQERFSKCSKFRLHDLTEPDIRIYITETLDKNEEVKAMTERDRSEILKLGYTLIERAEGVFLWVTLALKNLERGILQEDSIHDLGRKIDLLPRQVEELFSVIFNSIERDFDKIDRQRALKTLALVVAANGKYRFQTSQLQLSFIDNFESDQHFAEKIKSPVSEEYVDQCLRRCRKQVEGRCRGFLHIVHERRSRYFHRGYVVFTHRSLVEYFQKPEVASQLAPYSMLKDLLAFKVQACLAEVKYVSGRQWDQPNRDLFNPQPRELRMFNSEVEDLIMLGRYGNTDKVPTEFKETVQPLILFAEHHLDPPMFPLYTTYYSSFYKYNVPEYASFEVDTVQCRASLLLQLLATTKGLWDFSRQSADERQTPEKHQSEVEYLSLTVAKILLTFPTPSSPWYLVETKGQVRSLLGIFDLGISPCDSVPGGFSTRVSLWQLAIRSFLCPHYVSPVPSLLALLIYGADPRVWLEFSSSHGHELYEDCVSVSFQFGAGREEPYPACFLSTGENMNSGILELAKGKGWSLSFRDVVEFWVPGLSQKFVRLIELNTNRGEGVAPTTNDAKMLRRELRLEFDDWIEED